MQVNQQQWIYICHDYINTKPNLVEKCNTRMFNTDSTIVDHIKLISIKATVVTVQIKM